MQEEAESTRADLCCRVLPPGHNEVSGKSESQLVLMVLITRRNHSSVKDLNRGSINGHTTVDKGLASWEISHQTLASSVAPVLQLFVLLPPPASGSH